MDFIFFSISVYKLFINVNCNLNKFIIYFKGLYFYIRGFRCVKQINYLQKKFFYEEFDWLIIRFVLILKYFVKYFVFYIKRVLNVCLGES